MLPYESDLYQRIELLGQGSFGLAYLVKSRKDNEYCVIKQIDVSHMSQEEMEVQYVFSATQTRILSTLKHPNIIRFRDVYQTRKKRICIVMDYADGGDLAKQIKQAVQPFSENLILNWFTQLCLAVKHCHDKKIIHRDIKTSNVFLMKDGVIKLGDFGIAKILSVTTPCAKSIVGTPYYMAPEMFESQPYSFKGDIWSLGVVLYELCNRQPPFSGDNIAQLALKVTKGEVPTTSEFYSRELRMYIYSNYINSSLLGRLLSHKEHRRPSINEILREKIIKERLRNFVTETPQVKGVQPPRESLERQKDSPGRLPELKPKNAVKQRASPSMHRLPSIKERQIPNTPDFNKRVQLKQSPKKKSEVDSPGILLKSPSLQLRVQSGQLRSMQQASERNFGKKIIKPFVRQQSSRPLPKSQEGLFFSPKKQIKDTGVADDILKTIKEVESSPLTLTKSSMFIISNESNHSIEEKSKRNNIIQKKLVYKHPFDPHDIQQGSQIENDEHEAGFYFHQLNHVNHVREVSNGNFSQLSPLPLQLNNQSVHAANHHQLHHFNNQIARIHDIHSHHQLGNQDFLATLNNCGEQVKTLLQQLTSKLGKHFEDVYRQCKGVNRESGDLGQNEIEAILQKKFESVSPQKIQGIATLLVALLTQTSDKGIIYI